MKLRFGLDIKETDDSPELSSLIDHWHHKDAKVFDEYSESVNNTEYRTLDIL